MGGKHHAAPPIPKEIEHLFDTYIVNKVAAQTDQRIKEFESSQSQTQKELKSAVEKNRNQYIGRIETIENKIDEIQNKFSVFQDSKFGASLMQYTRPIYENVSSSSPKLDDLKNTEEEVQRAVEEQSSYLKAQIQNVQSEAYQLQKDFADFQATTFTDKLSQYTKPIYQGVKAAEDRLVTLQASNSDQTETLAGLVSQCEIITEKCTAIGAELKKLEDIANKSEQAFRDISCKNSEEIGGSLQEIQQCTGKINIQAAELDGKLADLKRLYVSNKKILIGVAALSCFNLISTLIMLFAGA